MTLRPLFTAIAMTAVIAMTAQVSMDKLQKQKQATGREIRETTRRISANNNEIARNVKQLEVLRAQVDSQNHIISHARTAVDSVNVAIDSVNAHISKARAELSTLQQAYAQSLRKLQCSGNPLTSLSFVLDAASVEEAFARVRYLRQFSRWRSRHAEDVKRAHSALLEQQQHLSQLGHLRGSTLSELNRAGKELAARQAETDRVVTRLRNEGEALKAYLAEKQKQQQQLDGQIDNLIRQEQQLREKQRKEAERKRLEAEKKKKEEEKKKREEEKRRLAEEKKKREQAASQAKPDARPQPKPETKPEPKPQPAVQQPDPDRALTGSFESNKGRLLFPVAGSYRIIRGFGRQPHPDLPHVMTDNSGIDISVAKGAQARAVFEGVVSAIFRQDGFNSIVMLRHGSYITIYAGLGTLSVKNGDHVKAGQALGTIHTDPDEGTILHFELRNERQKLNPTQWVK